MTARVRATASTYNRFVREGGFESIVGDTLFVWCPDSRTQVRAVGLELRDPPEEAETCRRRGQTYAAPLAGRLRVTSYDDQEPQQIEATREIEITLPPVPLMTVRDTFVIDGVDHALTSTPEDLPGPRVRGDGNPRRLEESTNSSPL
jgi:DNA-directed RNA polymerase beta subunit